MSRFSKVISAFFSMATTGALLVVFLVSIAYATFLENDYGTSTARILIYNARWFEVLLGLLAVNLVGSIFRYQLIRKKKWAVILFHISFLVILAGAAITRFTGFEGSIHIREGAQNNQVITEATYLTVSVVAQDDSLVANNEVLFSPYTANRFAETFTTGGHTFTVKNLRFVPSAAESIKEDPAGEPVIALLVADRFSKRYDLVLNSSERKYAGEISFGFESPGDGADIRITGESGALMIESDDTVFMAGMQQDTLRRLEPGSAHPFTERVVYQVGNTGFVLKQYLQKGRKELVYVPSHAGAFTSDALEMEVSSGQETRTLFVYGKKGETGEPQTAGFTDLKVRISYGSVIHELPFALKLNDFQIERYPGSNSPSSYASEVTLLDPGSSVEKPFRIFMNNILKYKGYRFFQSSFDEDEKGTVLSVNYDAVGTAVTYAGYFLMALGMILTFFSRRSRFISLVRSSAKLGRERKKVFTFLIIAGLLFAVNTLSAQKHGTEISPDHARKFGTLLVQNNEGRIEPVNTLASEILRKVTKKGHYNGLEPVQVMLNLLLEPEKWRTEPLIRVADADLRKMLGADGKYIAFNNVLQNDSLGQYKLRELVEKVYGKKPAERNRFDKEVVNVDERVNILYKFMNGGFLTIFPIPGDPANKWISPAEHLSEHSRELTDVTAVFSNYMKSLEIARQTGDYREADRFLSILKDNQEKHGATIFPPVIKTRLEMFYVNFNIFGKLAKGYVLLGVVLLIFQFISLLSVKSRGTLPPKAAFWMVFALFFVHTAGLGIRWYISGHAPWSNGYETLLYISWATCLTGLVLSARSPMTLAVTTLLSAISLFVAGMSWMSPELTNLVPVLKSYWLVIHVAVITASYGFFAVAALLGIFNLVLIILQVFRDNPKISFTTRELVLIIEIAFIIGLFMLTIGSFLGGVWANESWGRYWGWDPKETWAMVTILVYAFIVHMHNIPGFRGTYAVSLASVIGFCSVLMTYFGVNYYLSGLHSYAQGEPVPIPAGVYIGVVAMLLLSLGAWAAWRQQINRQNSASATEEM